MNVLKMTYASIVDLLKHLYLHDKKINMYLYRIKKPSKKGNIIVDMGYGSAVFSRCLENQQRKIVSIGLDGHDLKNFKSLTSDPHMCKCANFAIMYSYGDCVISITVIAHMLQLLLNYTIFNISLNFKQVASSFPFQKIFKNSLSTQLCVMKNECA